MSISCANCGAEIPEGASVCDNCGTPVSVGEPTREAPTRETAPPKSPAVSPPPEGTLSREASPRRREPLAQEPTPPRAPVPPPPKPPPATIPTQERQTAPVPPRRGRSGGRLLVVAGVLAAALLAVGVAAWFLAPSFGGGGDTLEVPSLEGQTLEEARRLAGDFEVVGDGEPQDIVESQEPAPGERASRGDEISVVLGSSSGTVAVPDVVGMVREDAEAVLSSEGFEVTVEGSESGEVVEQDPSGEAEEGSAVVISIGEPQAASGYTLVSDDTGALTLELPEDWVVVTGPESEVGGPSWSSFLGETVGTTVTASPDFDAWYGAPVSTGIYAVASRTLAEGYADEDLVVSGPSDFSPICTLGEAKDFERPRYQARIQAWKDCNGDPEAFLLAVAVAPEDRECVVVMQFGTTSQTDREVAQHIIDTFEVDCGGIAASASIELADAGDQVPEPAPAGHG